MSVIVPLSDEACWERLPPTHGARPRRLPLWARTTAVYLPRTTAAMLRLDHAQRSPCHISATLRAKLRWKIASCNRCLYAQRTAIKDLQKAEPKFASRWDSIDVSDEPTIEALMRESLSPSEQLAMSFIHRLTTAATSITEEMSQQLQEAFSERAFASMILLAAYGNFQDRLLLGLQIANDPEPPLLSSNIEFQSGALQIAPLKPAEIKAESLKSYVHNGALIESKESNSVAVISQDPSWGKITYRELQTRLTNQRNAEPRLSIPKWEQVRDQLPAEMREPPSRILWNLICFGYSPELAVPWTIATRTLWSELPSDRIFEESLFWVQTRAVDCNYCMGHCEMLLRVAGLSTREVADRITKLAESDWSSFPPLEQRAYAYARKLSRTPWELTSEEYNALVEDFGPARALSIFWWLCRGLYMTRVSDGFQLPLERENVFHHP